MSRNISFILVAPQLGWNIGSVARAMLNFGITDLRLVNPRDGWPNKDSEATAAGADLVLEGVRVFSSLKEAMADLNVVFASSIRAHDMVKPFYTPRAAIEELYERQGEGCRVGVVFGHESSGLTSADVSLCDGILSIPTNSEFSSMNLAHAAALVSYEWGMIQLDSSQGQDMNATEREYASKEDMNHFFAHLERELDETGFLTPVEKRPRMVKNIRSIFTRAHPTSQEVRTLRGIIRYLRRDYE